MTFKEIQELIRLINKTNLTEFRMKDGDFELSVRTEKYHKAKTTQVISSPQQIVPVPTNMASMSPTSFAAPAVPSPIPDFATSPPATATKKTVPPPPAAKQKLLEVKSPIIGTFYRSPSPEKPAYVKVGDSIAVGQVVCIVEAMKLFNEIESEVAGKIVKVLVEDAQPVEYDQVLYLVDPS